MKPATVLRTASVLFALTLGGSQLLASPIVITGLDPTNITTQGGVPQWTSGAIDLTSFNVSIGPSYSPLQLDLFLTGKVTTASDPNTNYGAWITLSPDVLPERRSSAFSTNWSTPGLRSVCRLASTSSILSALALAASGPEWAGRLRV